MLKLKVAGIGLYLPDRRETRDDFIKRGVPEEQIDYLGVYERRIMGAGQSVSDMELEASKMAIKDAGLSASDIDLIISVPIMQQMVGAANSNRLQYMLGATKAAAFDISQTCCALVPAMITAANFLTLGQYKRILLVASTYWSAIENPTDHKYGYPLSDGAAAVVLMPSEPGFGVLAFDMRTNGQYFYSCGTRVGESHNKKYHERHNDKLYFYIDESDIFGSNFGRAIMAIGPSSFKSALKKAELSPGDIDCAVVQGIAKPQLTAWIRGMRIPAERFPLTYSRFGHLSTSVILANLKEGLDKGMIRTGNNVAIVSAGAGISGGSIIMRWS